MTFKPTYQDNLSQGISRVQAPFGCRAVAVVRRDEYGPYVVLTVKDKDGPTPVAGQFYMVSTVDGWGGGVGERPYLPRACSVMRVNGDELQFMLDAVGPGTELLSAVSAGAELKLLGPLGVGFSLPSPDQQALLVGGGVGIAPLIMWQDVLQSANVQLGFRDADHAQAAKLFTNPTIATDDGSVGHHGFVTDLLEQAITDNSARTVYACGPPAMLEVIRMLCVMRNIPAQLALETVMACGYGACYGCAVPTQDGIKRLCVDGPVLSADTLISANFPGAAG